MWRTTIQHFRISKLGFWRHWGGGRHNLVVAKKDFVCLHLHVGRVASEGVCSCSGASQLRTFRFLSLLSSLTLLFYSPLGFWFFLVCLRNILLLWKKRHQKWIYAGISNSTRQQFCFWDVFIFFHSQSSSYNQFFFCLKKLTVHKFTFSHFT